MEGTTVDWLGIMITAGSRDCTFRHAFVQKITPVRDTIASGRYDVRFAWRAVALAVRALWVSRRPLALIRDALRWLVRTAVAMNAGRVRWDAPCRLWAAATEQLNHVWEWLTSAQGAFRVWVPDPVTAGWGMSDAAGGSHGARGWIVRIGDVVTVARLASGALHINFEEFAAMSSGLSYLVANAPSGTAPWYGDNTTANGWMTRSWSPRARHNDAVLHLAQQRERRRVETPIRWVPGDDLNMSDIITRDRPEYPRLMPRATWIARREARYTGSDFL